MCYRHGEELLTVCSLVPKYDSSLLMLNHSTQFWILIIIHFGLMGPWTLHITGILNITFHKLEMFLKCILFVIPNEAVFKPSKM